MRGLIIIFFLTIKTIESSMQVVTPEEGQARATFYIGGSSAKTLEVRRARNIAKRGGASAKFPVTASSLYYAQKHWRRGGLGISPGGGGASAV